MQYEIDPISAEHSIIATEMVPGIASTMNNIAASPVTDTSSDDMDSVTISEETVVMAAMIVPSLSDQESDDRFNMLISIQGGLVGPGGAMINIAIDEKPIYAIIRDGKISISGMDIYSAQNAYDIKQSTIRMLEYVQLLTQNVKIEEGQILQEKLMNITNSLANVQAEMVGDPNYDQKTGSLEEAYRNITSILIADAARVEYSDMPDNDRMIFEAREMAEMFNNLLFENLTKHGVKKSFDTAWEVL